MKLIALTAVAAIAFSVPASAQYMGNLTANRMLPPAPMQPPGTFNNQFGTGANSPKLFDNEGNFHGNVNSNQFDPNSIANPFGRYGSQFSPDSVNNQFGRYGSPYSSESPTNQFGNGMSIYGPNR